MNPETVDPEWFQELVRRAFERELHRLRDVDELHPDEATERAMWYVFDLRRNLAELYRAGAPGVFGESSS